LPRPIGQAGVGIALGDGVDFRTAGACGPRSNECDVVFGADRRPPHGLLVSRDPCMRSRPLSQFTPFRVYPRKESTVKVGRGKRRGGIGPRSGISPCTLSKRPGMVDVSYAAAGCGRGLHERVRQARNRPAPRSNADLISSAGQSLMCAWVRSRRPAPKSWLSVPPNPSLFCSSC
jgi:hypothetical protein